VTESVETSASEAAFDAKRREVLALLGFDADTPTVTGGEGEGLAALFVKLAKLDDAAVLAVLAVVMGETLDAHSDLVDLLGQRLAVDMSQVWQADDALLDLVRDREVLLAMVEDVAGKAVAGGNAKEKGKTLKTIVRDSLAGANGRPKVEGWVPRWLCFPASGYTARGGVGSAVRGAAAAALIAPEAEASEPEACEQEATQQRTAEPDAAELPSEPVRETA
jgi:ParB family chromosome partitioning protein